MGDLEKTLTIGGKVSASLGTALAALKRGFDGLASDVNRGFESMFAGLPGFLAGSVFGALTDGFRQMLDRWTTESKNRNLFAGQLQGEAANVDAVAAQYDKLALKIAVSTGNTKQSAVEAIALAKSYGVAADQIESVVQAGAGVAAKSGRDLKTGVAAVAELTAGHVDAMKSVLPEFYRNSTSAAAVMEDLAKRQTQLQAAATRGGEGRSGMLNEIEELKKAGQFNPMLDMYRLQIERSERAKHAQEGINEAARKGAELQFQTNAALQTEFTTMTSLARQASLRVLGNARLSTMNEVRDQNRTLAGNAGTTELTGVLSRLAASVEKALADAATARSYGNGNT